ncbi:helix-turn-helix domain-containing protein [Phenylobacterium montanum]|uniref:Helix-turn-helix transcriptional regulator n=1 Tax=Phenylobacterium montanum TaxID=2823693 RepID=A0A975G4K7_9CAUL|nr:helix-turn-helix transcriptional regulator [Caulobacter sp. S6]QUD90417.1 helix-turn-helix transcriptional regulator [Caulobacter sp. S6]
MPAKREIHPIDHHVGRQLRRLRKARGVSQTDLATALAISFQQIQKYETGANRMSASVLVEIALTLRAPITALFEGLPELAALDTGEGGADLAVDLLASPFGRNVAAQFPRLPLTVQERIAALLHALAPPPPPIGIGYPDWTMPPRRSHRSKLEAEIPAETPGDPAADLDRSDDLPP